MIAALFYDIIRLYTIERVMKEMMFGEYRESFAEALNDYNVSKDAAAYLYNGSRTAVTEVFRKNRYYFFTITALINDSFEDDGEEYSFWIWQRIYSGSGFYDTPERAIEAAAEEMRCRMLM